MTNSVTIAMRPPTISLYPNLTSPLKSGASIPVEAVSHRRGILLLKYILLGKMRGEQSFTLNLGAFQVN